MCMQCVASSTPMVAVGFGVLRRQALMGWLQLQRSRLRRLAGRREPSVREPSVREPVS